jgi:hypothetical protein
MFAVFTVATPLQFINTGTLRQPASKTLPIALRHRFAEPGGDIKG